VERLCSDLGLEPSDRRVLLLAWRMGAKRMGYFARDEFAAGMASLPAASLAQLQTALPRLDGHVASAAALDDFFAFAFKFCLTVRGARSQVYAPPPRYLYFVGNTLLRSLRPFPSPRRVQEPGQKIIDTDTAATMLEIVLPDGAFAQQFARFLRSQTDYRKVNADQWACFLRFSREVRPDLGNAADNPAWPVIIDNFVEFIRKERQQEAAAANKMAEAEAEAEADVKLKTAAQAPAPAESQAKSPAKSPAKRRSKPAGKAAAKPVVAEADEAAPAPAKGPPKRIRKPAAKAAAEQAAEPAAKKPAAKVPARGGRRR
jgi:DCN1-like protein 4/5